MRAESDTAPEQALANDQAPDQTPEQTADQAPVDEQVFVDARAERSPDWPDRATRWAQITLAEDDPEHFDLDFWLDLMRDSRSNATCISAGGYIAYYPTTIKYHYRSKYLGDTDPFGALVDGARGLGMSVMARVDPHAVHADAADAHPDWLARDIDGNPLEHWAHPDIWLTCAYTTYHSEFITEVAREIVREYDVDAVFANRWEGYYGISYSEAARRSFRDETGLELPAKEYGENWHEYVGWRRRHLSRLVTIWDEAVRDLRPHARFIPNLGALGARDLDREQVERHYPIFFIDKQGRSGTEAPWSAGRNGKRNRGVFPDRPVRLITSVGPEHHQYRWKDSVAPAEETKTWIVDGFAHGALPWFTKFNASVPDRRWVPPVVEAFTLHAQVEPVLEDLRITAEVALVDPTRAGQLRAGEKVSQHDDGFYQALVEARVPFEFVSDQALTADRLNQYKVLVLANAEQLGDDQCAALRAYVEQGGSLVAAYQSSLFDERGEVRADFGLSDVLGIHLVEPSRAVKNNYIALTDEHRLNEGFGDTTRIIGGTEILGIEADPDAVVPFRFIPDFPDLPMEEVYPRKGPDRPGVVCREHAGGGRTVYFPFNLGAIFWEALQSDHGRLIANAVAWALGKDPDVTVEGAGLVDVAVHQGEGQVAVALVNLTNPMAMRGPIRETLPLPPQTVTVALPTDPAGVEVRPKVRLVVAGVDVEPIVDNQRVVVTIPTAGLLEIVHVDWRQ
ncbi:trehalose utilization protein [Kribbella amoyensis]|uniref:Trehalose utilization protein n=1 Tax=Kribbella amoyensis TaxID=996641 RepID=A0A561B2Q8_9ACTN|nr:alpha-amylase family protein [Kribbella amoyensis]TWD73122.1 trehalose utilization protein [Kribbella amoyensis]